MRSHIRRNPAPTRTFYVDATGGNDANIGNSPGAAWQTVNNTLQGQKTLKPGDKVLLKRGETWADSKIGLGFSGKAGRHIYFGAYGTGAAPIVDAAAAQTYAFVAGNTRHFFVVEDIDFRGGTSGCVDVAGHDITLRRLNVQDNAVQSGIQMFGQVLHRIIIESCTSHDHTAGSGIEIGADALPGPREVQIKHNTVYGNGSSNAHHGIYVKRTDSFIIAGNTGYSNVGSGIKNRLYSTNGKIYNNYCYSNSYCGLQWNLMNAGCNVRAYNNLLVGNTTYNIVLSETTCGVEVYFNTLINGTYRGLGLDTGDEVGNIIKNNLIVQDGAVVGDGKVCVRVNTDGQAESNTFDYNLYIHQGNVAGDVCDNAVTPRTLAEWQALTGTPDTHSVNADPLVVTEWTNMHLQAGSPADGAGLAIAGITQDRDHVTRTDPPDIGCYQYV